MATTYNILQLTKTPDPMIPFTSTGLSQAPVTTTSIEFEDQSETITFTEQTVPATPVYARLTVRMESTAPHATAATRVKVRDEGGSAGTTYSDAAEVTGGTGIRTTGWVKVPDNFRAGFANIQLKSSSSDATTRVTSYTLELGYRQPAPKTPDDN